MTLPAFAAWDRRLLHGARSAPEAIDRYLLPGGRSAANPPAAVAAVDRSDRQTNRRTLDRYIDAAPPTMRADVGVSVHLSRKMPVHLRYSATQ